MHHLLPLFSDPEPLRVYSGPLQQLIVLLLLFVHPQDMIAEGDPRQYLRPGGLKTVFRRYSRLGAYALVLGMGRRKSLLVRFLRVAVGAQHVDK